MKLIAHQQVEGVDPGQEFTVDDERGQWLLDNGYAVKPGGDSDSTGADDIPPAKSASRAEWNDFAVSRGWTRDGAEAVASKDELIERLG